MGGASGVGRTQAGRVVRLPDGRDYRLGLVSLPAATGAVPTQAIFEDVTEERRERRLATRYAALVVQAEEDQKQGSRSQPCRSTKGCGSQAIPRRAFDGR